MRYIKEKASARVGIVVAGSYLVDFSQRLAGVDAGIGKRR